MMHIHVNIPLNLTALYNQADLFTTYLHTLKNTTTSTYKRIPFTKTVRDTGDFTLRQLDRIMKRLENIDHNLPHVETRQTREAKTRKKRGDQACIWGYSSHPEQCNLEHDVVQMALDSLVAIIEAINGPKYEDTEEYKEGQINQTLGHHMLWEKQILEYYVKPKPEFREKYWDAYSPTPTPPITTFKPWDEKSAEPRKRYLSRKTDPLIKTMGEISKEKDIAKKIQSTSPLPEFYFTTPEPTTTTFRRWDINLDESRFLYVQRRAKELARVFKKTKRKENG
jgi:hypothetical protein